MSTPSISSRLRLAALVLGLGAALGACSRERPPTAAVRPATDYFSLKVGAGAVRAQIAVLEPEMELGLMYRSTLGADDGMLFVYAEPRPLSFWMRNTQIPLDIGFFDTQGVLREVHPLQPRNERPVASLNPRLQFALEMNQGWFARNGVGPGARLDLGLLKAALTARGFEPRRFGLD